MSSSIYTTGGTVQAGGGIYLPRKADDELLQLCREGQFAYVLTPRQMGKSSLMVRTAERLGEEGVTSVIIDLTKIGTEVTAEQWYLGLLTEIDDALMLETDIFDWWAERQHLGVTQRLTRFFEEVLLAEVAGQLVVFVDEIDTTLSLDFTDDFFIAIRYFYVGRAKAEALGRLSFVLIGVATPGDLIRDPQRTPFNVGRRVELTDFTAAEALPFAQGLGPQGEEVLGWVMEWSGGHPYLTQRLCQGVAEAGSGVDEGSVNQLVEKLFLEGGERNDNNLLFVRDMLTQRTPNRNESVYEVLMTYRDVWLDRQPVLDEEQSLVKSHLKLAGIVRREADRQGALRVSNGVYRAVFDEAWVKEHLPTNWVKRLQRARAAIAALLAVTLVAVPLGVLAEYRRREAVEQRAEAQKQTILAQANSSRAFLLANQPLEGMVAAVAAWQKVEEEDLSTATMAAPARTALMGGAYYEPGFNLGPVQAKRFSKRSFREKNFLEGHGDSVISVAFSPDGETIASASLDRTVKLWDRQGKLLNTLEGHGDSVISVAFSPDGETIASASDDRTVKLWDRQGKLLNTLEGHGSSVWSVAFSPDGETIASASLDRTVKLWDRQGKLLNTLEGHGNWVISVAFSPDGETIASASSDRTVKLWDRQGKLLNTLEGHGNWVISVAFSPDGETIASASDDRTVKLWDRQGKLLNTLEGHGNWVRSVAFSPDGETIASASLDRTVKLWDRQGKLLNTLEGHGNWVISVAFSPDGETIASASLDRTVKLWDRQGKLLNTLEGHGNWVISVAFSPDGETIASASLDRTVKLWDRQGKLLNTLEGHGDSVISVAFSPDGETIASASDDRTVKLWDRQGKLLNTLEGHGDSVISVAFSPDGETIASASDDRTVKLWDRQGKLLNTLEGHGNWVISVAFSPDGETIASASLDRTVKLWDRQGKLLNTLEGHGDSVISVAFSPDGETIASASDDRTVKLWDRQGKLLNTLEGHGDSVISVAFSPDGETIASASDDRTVKLWDRQGKLLNTLEGHGSSVISVAFSPDGETIASASSDRTVKLWDRDPQRLLAWHCNWLRDYLLHNPDGQKAKADGVCRGRL